MRTRITFKVKNVGTLVPFHHQFLISQVLKGLIVTANSPEFVNYNLYSFSGLKGLTKVGKGGLHFNSSRVTLVISSPSKPFIKFITERILEQNMLQFGLLNVVPEQADDEQAVELTNETKYLCISPIVLIPPTFNSPEGKQFIAPGTDEFSDYLYDATIQRMESAGIDTATINNIEKFQLIPDQDYLTRMSESNRKIGRVYPIFVQDVKYEVRGYTFPFELLAPKEVQEFVFHCGLGHFGYKGFGMLDVANSNPVARIIKNTEEQMVNA